MDNSPANFAVVFMAILSILSSPVVAKNKVVVRNKVHSVVKVHCQSADNDLGVHYLGYGEAVSWSFNINIWDTTLFFCDIVWGRLAKAHIDVFTAENRFNCRNVECNWLILPKGFYLYDFESHKYHFKYVWHRE
ncbi:hypothetical protein FNV43_RR02265 [Rhamnella rubrinervis]|uniref:S-protein homolog n=1 Tax=Rhamnella rubrinervis TaxID=2594499 RepID=A0A8K0HR59_9ROSA|nr:hypothetical protein FNV43_RR02265 [Rhamnella rubrinervis]